MCSSGLAQHRFYVDASSPAAAGAQNGGGWATAWSDLQTALDAAAIPSPDDTKEIWVTDGYYEPTVQMVSGDPKSASFALPPNTWLFGGFEGQQLPYAGENSTNERTGKRYTATILSGKIAATGIQVRHVVYCSPSDLSEDGETWRAELNGFRIEDGRAMGSTLEDNRGGGVYALRTSLVVKNCELENNVAADQGGAIYWDSGQVIGVSGTYHTYGLGISRSRFKSNLAVNSGGAVYAYLPAFIRGYLAYPSCPGTPTSGYPPCGGVASFVQNCEFVGNMAGLTKTVSNMQFQSGGAITMFNPELSQISGNLFTGNQVRGRGSAIYIDFEFDDPQMIVQPYL